MVKKTLRKWLRGILNEGPTSSKLIYASDAVDEVKSTSSPYRFVRDFEGWNFRIHGAHGGAILEVWYTGSYNHNSVSSYPSASASKAKSLTDDHRLYTFSNSEEMIAELPNILTMLALGTP